MEKHCRHPVSLTLAFITSTSGALVAAKKSAAPEIIDQAPAALEQPQPLPEDQTVDAKYGNPNSGSAVASHRVHIRVAEEVELVLTDAP